MASAALVFYALAGVMLGSAVMVVTRRNPVHSALYLVLTFLSMAGIFVLLEAEFVAAVQVLVYAGGIMVLFLFVVLLVGLHRLEGPARTWQALAGVGATALVVLMVLSAIGDWQMEIAPNGDALREGGGNLQMVGRLLYTSYLLPFELASVLLLVAIVGAVLLALRRDPGTGSHTL
jgi:NADH-quinone oxidoreductase subunit J